MTIAIRLPRSSLGAETRWNAFESSGVMDNGTRWQFVPGMVWPDWMITLTMHRRWLTTLLVAMLALMGCTQLPATGATPTPLEPANCLPALVEQMTSNLFAAINRGDDAAVIALFPRPGPGTVVVQPELEFSAVPSFPPGDLHHAATPDELRDLVGAASGYHLHFESNPHGWIARIDYLIDGERIQVWTSGISDAHWVASRSGKVFRGGSKIAVNCATRLFIRAAL